MKILIVNYYYPPLIDAHAYRWEQIARHWAASGHEVEVITGRIAGVPDRAQESGIGVTRTGAVARPVGEFSNVPCAPSYIGKIQRRFIDFIRHFYRKLYWPDASWHWLPYLLAELLRRRRTRYDIIVSYYPCMAALLGVYAFRAVSCHPSFYWIVDYGDPFSTSATMQPNNYALYSGLNRFAEGVIVRAADVVVFTNRPTAQACEAALGYYGGKIHVIPHLVDIMRFYSGDAWRPKNVDEGVLLNYIGGFHKGIREPARLFELMRRLNGKGGRKYSLRIYGPLNNFRPEDLAPPDCPEISYLGSISRPYAIEALKRADVIINVDNENCMMTPSKIVECIATGRPLMNLANAETIYPPFQDYTEKGYALAVTDGEVTEAIVHKVQDFLEAGMKMKTAPAEIVKGVLASHTLEKIAADYLNLCRSRK